MIKIPGESRRKKWWIKQNPLKFEFPVFLKLLFKFFILMFQDFFYFLTNSSPFVVLTNIQCVTHIDSKKKEIKKSKVFLKNQS